MPLHESDSIILKTYPLAEADRIVVFFSRDYGKLRGVANGVRRMKSGFGASLEPLARSKVTFFRKETFDLVRIRSTELVDSPMKLLGDYDRAVLAAHAADLVDRFLPDHEVHDEVFRLFNVVRQSLIDACPLELARCYFEVWMLRLAGVFPDLFTCSLCSRRMEDAERRVLLPGLTSVGCGRCERGEGIDMPSRTVDAFRWILTRPLSEDSGRPETEGLQHVGQLDKLWMDRFFDR